jgi:hypothetical protein
MACLQGEGSTLPLGRICSVNQGRSTQCRQMSTRQCQAQRQNSQKQPRALLVSWVPRAMDIPFSRVTYSDTDISQATMCVHMSLNGTHPHDLESTLIFLCHLFLLLNAAHESLNEFHNPLANGVLTCTLKSCDLTNANISSAWGPLIH